MRTDILSPKISYLTSVSFFFLAAGLITSVSILSIYQILFTVSVLFYAYVAYQHKDYRLPTSAYFLLAFTLVAFFTSCLNADLMPKPGKNFGRLKYFIFGMGGIFVFKYWLKSVEDQVIKNILRLFFLSLVVAGLLSLWQVFVLKEIRATGFTHTLRYGYGSSMSLLLLLGAILHHEKLKRWIDLKLALAAFTIGFVAFFITYTRGALLGFLCGLPFALHYFNRKAGLTLGALSILAVLGLGGIYLFGSGDYGSRFLVNKNNGADVIRRSQWKAALIATEERPILGWGLSNFHSQLKRIKHQYDLDAKDYDDAHSHNLFLEVASGTGLVGLFFFLGWVISWAVECFKGGGLVRALVVPFGVCFVVASQFEVTFDANNASLIFFVYSVSALLAFREKNQRPA